MQTKKGSLIEAVVNTLIGFTITLLFSPLIYWICGVNMKASQMGLVTALFTLLSILRGYVVRRFFNKVSAKNINTDAAK